MEKLKIDPEFRDKIPHLTDAEFEQLRENILADGEVFEPLVVWNGTIVDGHNRYKIVQEHPEIPYHIKEMNFADKWEAFAWMFKNQLGRRNIQAKDRDILIDGLVEARKKSHGASDGFRGNQHTLVKDQSGHLPKDGSTRRAVAKELGVGEGTVQRAQQLGNGLRELEKVSPEAAKIYRTTSIDVPRHIIREIPNMEQEDVAEIAEAIVEGKPENISTEKRRGWTKADREDRAKLEAIVADMYDPSTVPEFTIDWLIDDIQLNAKNYVDLLRNTLKDRSTLLTDENKPKIADAIQKYVIDELLKVKELVEK